MVNSIYVEIARSKETLHDLFAIRNKVFVEEQGVDETSEHDEYESSSTHLIAWYNNHPAGTCRFRKTESGIKLERFAVLQRYRQLSIGSALLTHCLNLADRKNSIYLHAQMQVEQFYAKHGFVRSGELFEEAGIWHYKMVWQQD
jgi:predicted GNAT family N-acyltransferase